MENENELELDSQNQPEDIAIGDEDDIEAIRGKFDKLSEDHKKVLDANKQLFARAKKAEGFELKDGKWVKVKPVEPEPKPEPPAKTGELDETQLDYLDLKGISDPDEIDVIQKVIAKTGQTVRQTLKDEYVQSKLETIRQEKAVKNATPSGTKRGGGQTDNLASALAKFEQTGELPEDFELRSAVINAKVDRENTNKPAWHK